MEKELKKSLEQRFKAYQEGGDRPVVWSKIKFMVDGEGFTATLSKEIEDRDGETVILSGMTVPKSVPLLDSHSMNDKVVDNVLGRVINILQRKTKGIVEMKGELIFARSPRGQIAKMLVEDGMVDSVSIGFGVEEFDPVSKEITKSELFETSLVSVPANPAALIDGKKSLKEQEEEVGKLEKMLAHYKEIKPAMKEVYKTFLSENFVKEIGYKKQGDLLIDINEIYSVIFNKLKAIKSETPKIAEKTSPTKQISTKELMALIKAVL